MIFPAQTVGYAIPDTDFAATVHSVFRSALNLRPDGGDLLLTLVAASEADLPQGIRVDTLPGFSFEMLQPGMRLTCRDKLLSFENSSLTIDLRSARRWQCALPPVDFSNPGVQFAWKLAWQTLNNRQVRLGAEIVAENLLHAERNDQTPVSRRMGEVIRTFVDISRPDRFQRMASRKDNLRDFNTLSANDLWKLVRSALLNLIGLGSGLTPSGDDFLVGYLAGLWCAVQGRAERQQFVSSLGETVIQLSGRTNDISRTYLCHAAQGQVSHRLETLAGAIGRGETSGQLLTAVESAMQAGHSSGMDAVTGLLIGLTIWAENHPGEKIKF